MNLCGGGSASWHTRSFRNERSWRGTQFACTYSGWLLRPCAKMSDLWLVRHELFHARRLCGRQIAAHDQWESELASESCRLRWCSWQRRRIGEGAGGGSVGHWLGVQLPAGRLKASGAARGPVEAPQHLVFLVLSSLGTARRIASPSAFLRPGGALRRARYVSRLGPMQGIICQRMGRVHT